MGICCRGVGKWYAEDMHRLQNRLHGLDDVCENDAPEV